jgi:hypothetical protein
MVIFGVSSLGQEPPMRHSFIRNEPCPQCGSFMLWTMNAWRVRGWKSPGVVRREDEQWTAAYRCENPVCGKVLDPQRFFRTGG